jgi:serine/threonine-protein kinase
VDGDDLEASAAALSVADLDIAHAWIVFDQQDSGCVSYGVHAAGRRWFVKVARGVEGEASLANALRLHEVVRHPAIVRPLRALRAGGLALVYPWVEGRVLNHATSAGSDRRALEAFRRLPTAARLAAIGAVLDAQVSVAAQGFVAVDFYDGCLLYDFRHDSMHLIDLDEYRQDPFTLAAERLPGSLRYMAPEEFRRGATIDQRTNVFSLGRMIHQLLDSADGWSGTAAQAEVVRTATEVRPEHRFASVSDLLAAWRAAAETV